MTSHPSATEKSHFVGNREKCDPPTAPSPCTVSAVGHPTPTRELLRAPRCPCTRVHEFGCALTPPEFACPCTSEPSCTTLHASPCTTPHESETLRELCNVQRPCDICDRSINVDGQKRRANEVTQQLNSINIHVRLSKKSRWKIRELVWCSWHTHILRSRMQRRQWRLQQFRSWSLQLTFKDKDTFVDGVSFAQTPPVHVRRSCHTLPASQPKHSSAACAASPVSTTSSAVDFFGGSMGSNMPSQRILQVFLCMLPSKPCTHNGAVSEPSYCPCHGYCQPDSGQRPAAPQTAKHDATLPKCTLTRLCSSRTGSSELWLAKPFWHHTPGNPIRPSNLDPSCLTSHDLACIM